MKQHMIIDTHAHLTDKVFDAERERIINSLAMDGISAVINVGYDYNSSKLGVELSAKYPQVFAAIGTHPHDAADYTAKHGEYYRQVATNNKVVAIGEIGLDYHYDNSPRDKQREVFAEQLKIADSVGLPVIIHTREAETDTLQVLDDNRSYINNGLLIHCFSGDKAFAQECKDRGFYLAFGGAITYKNNRTAPDVVSLVGLDNVVLETDCPYLSPVPYRGQVNQPKNTRLVAEKISEWLMVDVEEVINRTTENAYRFFSKLKE